MWKDWRIACWTIASPRRHPAAATEHVDNAWCIFVSTDARNDSAKALVTRAGLFQNSGDLAWARELLERQRRPSRPLERSTSPSE